MARSRIAALVIALSVGTIAGCAATPSPVVVDNHLGKMRYVARIERSYAGAAYTLQHHRAHPYPGGASSGIFGDGGEVVGTICGAGVRYQVQHRGDYTELRGAVDGTPALLRVEDQGGRRLVSGAIGARPVVLTVAAEGVVAGGVTLQPMSPELRALTPATQAALLPLWSGGCTT